MTVLLRNKNGMQNICKASNPWKSILAVYNHRKCLICFPKKGRQVISRLPESRGCFRLHTMLHSTITIIHCFESTHDNRRGRVSIKTADVKQRREGREVETLASIDGESRR